MSCQKQCLLGLWRLLTQEPLLVLCRARDRWPFGLLDINNTCSVKVRGYWVSFRTYIVLIVIPFDRRVDERRICWEAEGAG